MNNRERTLSAARQLMNEHGADAIGTNQIADATGISPGNIYYHFKNKEEIVRTLFGELEATFADALTADIETPISPARFAGFYLRSLKVSWDYRFFFGGLLQLLRKDEELAERYRKLQAWAVDNLEAIARQVAADGHMTKPKGRGGFRSVAVGTWLIWSNWIRYAQISSPTHEVQGADMVDGVSQIFDVLAPYLDPAFDRAARRVLARELGKLEL
ncbi:MAG: TetR/AcrR family transcriptional regulator [Parvibaculum sp.]